MKPSRIPKAALGVLKSIRGKRARIVVEHILKHGSITTEELKEKYGYDHPPRAIRDVIDQGVPLEKTQTTNKAGRRIAQYRFGDLSAIRSGRIGGRRLFPKSFRVQLSEVSGGRCGLCNAKFETRSLQIDHRVPYEVAGGNPSLSLRPGDFMLLCGSCNRAKSWSCEHCRNWTEIRSVQTCQTCYWANLQRYTHVAMQEIRRLDLTWSGDEVTVYDRLQASATESNTLLPDFVKKVLEKSCQRRD